MTQLDFTNAATKHRAGEIGGTSIYRIGASKSAGSKLLAREDTFRANFVLAQYNIDLFWLRLGAAAKYPTCPRNYDGTPVVVAACDHVMWFFECFKYLQFYNQIDY